MKFTLNIFVTFIYFVLSSSLVLANNPLEGFDHKKHDLNVFTPKKIDCTHCHNFKVDKITKKVIYDDPSLKSVFKLSMKQICHECHQSSDPKWASTPKACFTCHKSLESLGSIKPLNHSNVAWKTSHSIEARVKGDECQNCHTVSQCAKCHLRRNDIEFSNHSRNFRFTHSVVARAQPQRCDSCHTKSYCIQCHLGNKR